MTTNHPSKPANASPPPDMHTRTAPSSLKQGVSSRCSVPHSTSDNGAQSSETRHPHYADKVDIIIVGAGPAGLSLARMLQQNTALRIVLIERANRAFIASPKPDGRDLALSLQAQALLMEMGVWQHLPKQHISPLREARVTNGTSAYFLGFHDPDCHPNCCGNSVQEAPIGHFVPNVCIRQALWDSINATLNATQSGNDESRIDFLFESEVVHVGQGQYAGEVTLKDGRKLSASLVVAADSRFSATRDNVGIATHRLNFARTCIVFQVEHEYAHEQVAYECFMNDITLAVLPLNGNTSSIVLTLPPARASDLMKDTPENIAAFIAEAFQYRLGSMTLTSAPTSYPLVATYASRFYADRFALIGDAAVGMHPVTAHGYNFGLKGASVLAKQLEEACRLGLDIGAETLLKRYSFCHRNTTLPLFIATNSIVQFFASSHPLVRKAQGTLLVLGKRLSPVRNAIIRHLLKKKAARG